MACVGAAENLALTPEAVMDLVSDLQRKQPLVDGKEKKKTR